MIRAVNFIRAVHSRSMPKTFNLESFCLRQFDDPNYTGTRIEYEKKAFEDKVNELFDSGEYPLRDGYAPFCKHIFIPNFTEAKVNCMKIDESNEHLMKSGYEARTPKELPVLSRWFPAEKLPAHKSKYLDIILYSREQIEQENEAMGNVVEEEKERNKDIPWGIISVKAQDVNHELPMQPITVMRNSLGKSEGGSGVELNREKYMESVNYWREHAILK